MCGAVSPVSGVCREIPRSRFRERLAALYFHGAIVKPIVRGNGEVGDTFMEIEAGGMGHFYERDLGD